MWINIHPDLHQRVVVAIQNSTVTDQVGILRDFLATVKEYGNVRTPEEEKYFQAARQFHSRDGELEFDEDALVSLGSDPGAYVMGWYWISNSQAGVQEEAEDDHRQTAAQPGSGNPAVPRV